MENMSSYLFTVVEIFLNSFEWLEILIYSFILADITAWGYNRPLILIPDVWISLGNKQMDQTKVETTKIFRSSMPLNIKHIFLAGQEPRQFPEILSISTLLLNDVNHKSFFQYSCGFAWKTQYVLNIHILNFLIRK